jgi:hypothetical protein
MGTIIHLKGRPRCFVFDGQLEVAKFLHRQNQSVQKTPLVCMCPAIVITLRAFSIRKDDAKLVIFPQYYVKILIFLMFFGIQLG